MLPHAKSLISSCLIFSLASLGRAVKHEIYVDERLCMGTRIEGSGIFVSGSNCFILSLNRTLSLMHLMLPRSTFKPTALGCIKKTFHHLWFLGQLFLVDRVTGAFSLFRRNPELLPNCSCFIIFYIGSFSVNGFAHRFISVNQVIAEMTL